ncbi:ATP-dependent protease LonB [Halalkalibacterium halodurans]|uniref:endopeptidase La n=2 Tax=Halalkalibacterium halodurans TaxID=86665 RepID=Q9K8F5_HALH5|nr:ATP-dependent protease LonB [Halalkalibacterium halodurans]MDY7223597.1 ATP-dependent protease LonB [Halalkalibacterium halodurans]MDY7242818.1 ATP-dependent protease LonB [Halalkalibacterium halodurans]MED3647757.1 ATP-dependent protease LonB [Halalkalibacterium halodurans]MED4082195.1 ATP-dependent protease LonB [Halalkalibacterium halodurans]MED4084502.1 ATP-dependent protease LonB [Halalkalibacterium halodurans]
MNWTGILFVVQLFFGVVIGLYFWNLLKTQRSQRVSIDRESRKEMDQLRKLQSISLSEPLSEKVRPESFEDIVGQKEGIRALKAALCGPNPQHVIIYGPPGVGKTAAARLVLQEAKKNPNSPFAHDAVFVELDGTTARFDERGIADPLIGSVHDPIYQGAGAMGQAGIPQPKQGAVTKAHGGMLFIDEIGELHSIQINKLLKVLEDRKVFLESAYYSEENQQIPRHIHEIFQRGLPADFRLVGATTRMPEEIPPAIRSRCLEVYFRSLKREEIVTIAKKAVNRLGFKAEEGVYEKISAYATNGRETVNIVQIAAGMATTEGRHEVTVADVEWVIHSSQLSPRPERQIPSEPKVGLVNGLAVFGPNTGALLEVEVDVIPSVAEGSVTITGIAEEEQTGNQARSIRRKSMAKGSVENVLTVLKKMDLPIDQYDIHINFPGGAPVDGPSAGVAIATGIYSAIKEEKVDNTVAMTGEISIHGTVKPVGGIVAKVEAAKASGAKTVLIPKENEQAILQEIEGITIIPMKHLDDVLSYALIREETEEETIPANQSFVSAPAPV